MGPWVAISPELGWLDGMLRWHQLDKVDFALDLAFSFRQDATSHPMYRHVGSVIRTVTLHRYYVIDFFLLYTIAAGHSDRFPQALTLHSVVQLAHPKGKYPAINWNVICFRPCFSPQLPSVLQRRQGRDLPLYFVDGSNGMES
jgi:hypothetical protein